MPGGSKNGSNSGSHHRRNDRNDRDQPPLSRPQPHDPNYQSNKKQNPKKNNQNGHSEQKQQNPLQKEQNQRQFNHQQISQQIISVRRLETYNKAQRQSMRSNQSQENKPMLSRNQQQQQYGAQNNQNNEDRPPHQPTPRQSGLGLGRRHSPDDPYGDMPPPVGQIEGVKYGLSFQQVENRLSFMKKVFGLLVVQLFIIVSAIMIPLFSSTAKLWIQTDCWLYYATLAVWVIILILCSFSTKYQNKFPINYLLFFLFTFSLSYSIMYGAAISSPLTAFAFAVYTLALVTGLSIYAQNATIDLTYGGTTVAIYLPLIMILIIQAIFFWNELMIGVFCVCYCIIIGYYLIFHLQTIIEGNRYELYCDDYVIESIIIYGDHIQTFIILVKKICKKR